jgi:hypothetical protein
MRGGALLDSLQRFGALDHEQGAYRNSADPGRKRGFLLGLWFGPLFFFFFSLIVWVHNGVASCLAMAAVKWADVWSAEKLKVCVYV